MRMIKKLFCANRWKIAYRIDRSSDIFDFSNKIPFTYVSFPKGFWGADPFLFKHNEKIYIFCEYTNEKKSKSYISFKELYPSEEKEWHVAYEFEGHTSYPCIFEHSGELFMIPETTFDNSVRILKFGKGKWKEYSCLLNNINAPDTTFVRINSKPFIFLYEIISRDKRVLHLCELNNELSLIINDIIIKKYSSPDGRPGGNCFAKDGKLYRVVQPGIKRYGEKLNIFEFSFDGKNYDEQLCIEIMPCDVFVKNKKSDKILGVHTFNKVDQIEVIDMLIRGKFDLFRPFKILFKRLRIFGFGQYEKDKLLVNKEFIQNN